MSNRDDPSQRPAARTLSAADRVTRNVALALIGVIVIAVIALAFKALSG